MCLYSSSYGYVTCTVPLSAVISSGNTINALGWAEIGLIYKKLCHSMLLLYVLCIFF